MNPDKNPVTKLISSKVELSNGVVFTLIHNLPEATFQSLLGRCLKKTRKPTAITLIYWIKKRKPYCICITQDQFDAETLGKIEEATEAEYLAQQQKK